ncbi:MAG: anaerobic ribonucleoside-triphosphate reductase activating protein [Clostridia bacterium]|nr:anaerobic ribonucleoside-triphosphate reductase activating protein [Clostridia bacterium]
MVINGFQKMTLLDYPGRVACTLFTAGCNFRCPFCHNAALVTEIRPEDRLDESEILAFLARRKGLLEGVAVTGGEPLLQPGIEDFLARIRDLGYPVKLDTNGSFPERLASVAERGLVNYVAMDLKNRPEKYALTAGVPDLDLSPIRESAAFLMSTNALEDYEFRTTVVKEFHTVPDISAVAEWVAGAKHYYLQNFEDSGSLIGRDMHPVAPETLREMASAASRFVPSAAVRGI